MPARLREGFTPAIYDSQLDPVLPLRNTNANAQWLPLISCPADFPNELFEIAVSQLIHHPEYNSTLILRSETLRELKDAFPPETPEIEGYRKFKSIHRMLLPRRPNRDTALEQYCTLYSSNAEENADLPPNALVLSPIVPPGTTLPYYHPKVAHLALRYINSAPPFLRIEVLPLPDTPSDPNSRLYRTCLALLETLYRYGWGALTNYKKRVLHDCLIPREEYQDLYLIMRERYKHLVDTWQEVTDPLKHVFEDIGIATYLMLLWKTTYHHIDIGTPDAVPVDPDRPWIAWPRPPNGFLDLGCGNGLLAHILISEGYRGSGIDVRARTSWAQYPDTTQAHLHVHAFDPTSPTPASFAPPGVFIIGNHADELTPWVPIFATIHKASGYLSIPCCAWSFDAKFDRSSASMFEIPSDSDTGSKVHPATGLDLKFVESLNLGGDGSNTSTYSVYRIWLSTLSLHCGWEVECETLRIPSTRNWAIIGRHRLSGISEEEAIAKARAIVSEVVSRGAFKTRKPEGKGGEH